VLSRDALIRSVDYGSRTWLNRVAYHPWVAIFILVVLTFCSYRPSQTLIPAVDRTEPLVAVVSRDLVISQDILRPSYRGKLQIARSAGTFWLQGLVAAAAGQDAHDSIGYYRLPSLIMTTLAVILMFVLSRGLIGPLPAFLASLVVAVTPIIALHAHLAIAEPLILPAIICAQLLVLRLYVRPLIGKREQRLMSMAFWGVLGISTWFNALAVPLLSFVTVAVVTACDRNLQLVRRLEPWFGVPVMSVFALPWILALAAKSGGWPLADLNFWQIVEILEGGQNEKITFVPGSYILTVAIGFVPIAYLLGPVVQGYWHQTHDRLIRFCLVWLLAPIVALELLSNEPPLYTVQAVLPAAAMLVALAIAPGQRFQLTTLKPWLAASVAALSFALIVGPLVFAAIFYVTATPLQIVHVAGYSLVAVLFVLAVLAASGARMLAWFAFGCAGAWALNVWFFAVLMPSLQNFWTAPQIEQVVAKVESCRPGTHIDLIGFREPSAVFALGNRAAIREAPSSGPHENTVTLVESQFEEAFLASQPNAVNLGCFKSINIARPAFLTFKVFAPANAPGFSACGLSLRQECANTPRLLTE